MIDHKIPQAIRDEIALIEIDGTIVAVLYGEDWALGDQTKIQAENYFYINQLR
jgi:hypothetical protein